jgi:hypothetical protein
MRLGRFAPGRLMFGGLAATLWHYEFCINSLVYLYNHGNVTGAR